MKLQVCFSVDVDYLEREPVKPPRREIEDSVAEAIANALQAARDRGFTHSLETRITILCDSEIKATLIA